VSDDRDANDPTEQGGVFGNLPGSRPGTRSPRRGSGSARKRAQPAPAKRRAAPAKAARPRPAPKPPPQASPEQPAEATSGAGGIEEIAWAGVAVAAEAATLGVRLASRAIGALRGSTDRR
jgi:hypothetical protein